MGGAVFHRDVAKRDRLGGSFGLVDRGESPLNVARAAVVRDGGGQELEHVDMVHDPGLYIFRLPPAFDRPDCWFISVYRRSVVSLGLPSRTRVGASDRRSQAVIC